MKNKLMRIGRLLYASFFIIALFTLIRIICLANYHAGANGGNYTTAMMLMDKVHQFQLVSYITGWLHCGVACVMLKIILDK